MQESPMIGNIEKIYNDEILTMEIKYLFDNFYSQKLTHEYFIDEQKAGILLVGQKSTGKTTFIKKIVEKIYNDEILPMEKKYLYNNFYSQQLTNEYFIDEEKAGRLLAGLTSTGKTHLLKKTSWKRLSWNENRSRTDN